MSKKVRLGIIGIGNMGSAHARSIFDGKCPEIELTAVADIDEAKLAEAKKNYPDADKIGFFNTAEALMEGWARVCQAKTMDGGIRVICLEEPPEVDMTVKVWVIR